MSTCFINQQIILQNNITKTYFLGQHSNNLPLCPKGGETYLSDPFPLSVC